MRPLPKHPAIYLIVYLVFRGDDHNRILEILSNKGLSDWYNKETFDEIESMVSFVVQDCLEKFPDELKATTEAMSRLKIRGAWDYLSENKPGSFCNAWRLMHDPYSRQVIDQLLIGGTKPEEISEKLKDDIGQWIETADIETYRHYFMSNEMDQLDYRKYFAYDSNMSQAFSSRPYLRWIHGLPVSIEWKEMVESVRNDAFFKYQECMSHGDIKLNQAMKWMNAFLKAGQVASKITSGNKNVIDELRQLKLQYEERELEHKNLPFDPSIGKETDFENLE